MTKVLSFLLACVLAFGAVSASVAVFAGEADDEEAAAQREKEARDKLEAEKKAKKNPGAPGAKDVSPEAVDPSASPDAIDLSKLTGKADASAKPAIPGNNAKTNPFAPANPANPGPGAGAGAAKPGAPVKPGTPPADTVCPLCKGMRILPNLPYKPYTKYEGQPAPVPDFAPAWKFCDKCQKGADIKQISEEMKAQQERATGKHKQVDEWAGKPLKMFQTPFVSVFSQLTPTTNKAVGNALEKCAKILQENSRSMVLMTTRPDEDDIVMLADEKTFDEYIDKAYAQNEKSNKDLLKKGGGVSGYHHDMFRMIANGPPAECVAVFGFGGLIISSATENKLKPWLNEGFSAYCENVTMNTNSVYRFSYEVNQVKFDKNWNEAMKKCFKKNELKPWVQIFEIDLSHMKAFEYLTCYSVVSFLIRNDPVRFDKMVQNIRNGDDTIPAIEKAYGMKITQLQSAWVQWVQTQK